MSTTESPSPYSEAALHSSQGEKKIELLRSRYNFFVKSGDVTLAYNARKGKFAMLSAGDEDLLLSKDPIDSSVGRENLVRMGFLHYGDELQQIEDSYNDVRKTGNQLSIALAPTLRCNLSCLYCYQEGHGGWGTMSIEIQEATIRFVAARMKEIQAGASGVVPTVRVIWCGGEVLLERDIVLKVTRRIRETAARMGRVAEVSMISNCSLMDSATAKALSDVGIKSVKVSFDALFGDGETRRGVLRADGEPSQIFRNAVAAQDHMTVQVGLNVFRDNQEDILKMIERLESEGLSATFGLKRVFGDMFHGSCRNCSTPHPESRSAYEHAGPPVMTVSEFAKLESRIQLDHSDAKRSILKKLLPRPHHCGASAMSLFVVDPDGHVSRCMKSAGLRSEATGHVLTDRESEPMRSCVQQWRDYSPFRDPVCRDCNVLPLCMGGCPHVPLFSTEKGRRQCIPIRDQVQDFVERAARSLQPLPPKSFPM